MKRVIKYNNEFSCNTKDTVLSIVVEDVMESDMLLHVHTKIPTIPKGIQTSAYFKSLLGGNSVYRKAISRIPEAKAIKLKEISKYGATLTLSFNSNKDDDIQLTKKTLSWGQILYHLYGKTLSDKELVNEMQKHGIVTIK